MKTGFCFASIFLAFAQSACIAQTESPEPQPVSKPNILLILVDDMGWGDLGAFHQNARAAAGLPAIQTPNLDRLAAEGVQLRNHYSACPVCAPARASLFSGVHQGHAETVRDNSFDIPLENSHTLGTLLKQADYRTGLIGKWGIGGGAECGGSPESASAFPTRRGFDTFFGIHDHIAGHRHYPKEDPCDKRSEFHCNAIWDQDRIITADCDHCYSTDLFTARAKKWIIDHRAQSPGQPFFLALTLIAPHAALEVPTQPYPAGGGLSGGLRYTGVPGALINTASGKNDSFIYPQYAQTHWPEGAKRHATMITRVDEAVGDLRQTLADLKIADNTVVVFLSDNGPHNEGSFRGPAQNPAFFQSYGPFDGIKRDCYEGGMRVPALMCGPGIAPAVDTRPSQFHDWMATFADFAGIPAPMRCDGVSLRPRFLPGSAENAPASTVYGEYFFPGKKAYYPDFDPARKNAVRNQQQMLVHGNFKAVRTDIKDASTPFAIYNVAVDPGERHNLADTSEGRQLQALFQKRALQVRRPYFYVNNHRGSFAARPYDKACVPADSGETVAPRLWLCSGADLPDYVIEGRAVKSRAVAPPSTFSGNTELPAQVRGFAEVQLDIPADGAYEFAYTSPGAKAYIKLADFQLIDADKNYVLGTSVTSSMCLNGTEQKAVEPKNGWVYLQKGKHTLTIGFRTFDAPSGFSLTMRQKGETAFRPAF